MSAGRPLEPAGNGRPRWMAAAGDTGNGAAGHRIRRTGRLVRRPPGHGLDEGSDLPILLALLVIVGRSRSASGGPDSSAYRGMSSCAGARWDRQPSGDLRSGPGPWLCPHAGWVCSLGACRRHRPSPSEIRQHQCCGQGSHRPSSQAARERPKCRKLSRHTRTSKHWQPPNMHVP